MKSATYIGPDCGWNVRPGMRALIQPHATDPEKILAQFHDFEAQRAGLDLAFGWHEFKASEFKEDPEISWGED